MLFLKRRPNGCRFFHAYKDETNSDDSVELFSKMIYNGGRFYNATLLNTKWNTDCESPCMKKFFASDVGKRVLIGLGMIALGVVLWFAIVAANNAIRQ